VLRAYQLYDRRLGNRRNNQESAYGDPIQTDLHTRPA
jgi:hypothetical protein